jgi:ubiquinone/menaquinone biosynthesis C-methylase UbiE
LTSVVDLLRCRSCGASNFGQQADHLTCLGCQRVYPIVEGIPDFVSMQGLPTGQREIASYYADEADKYNVSHGSVLPGTEYNISAHYMRLLETYIGPGDQILEIGCGTGRFSQVLRRLSSNLVGTDFSLPMLLQDKGSVPIKVCADTQDLPFRDNIFDICVGIATFSYVPNKEAAVRSMRRVLKPNGRVLLIDMNRKSPIFALSPLAYGDTRKKAHQPWIRESSVTNYRTLFENGGFKILDSGHFSFVPHVAPEWFVFAAGPLDRLLSYTPFARRLAMRLYIVAENST